MSMAKHKKKHDKRVNQRPASPSAETGSEAVLSVMPDDGAGSDDRRDETLAQENAAVESGLGDSRQEDATPLVAAPLLKEPASRVRRLLPDIVKVTLAFACIGVAAVIWYKPPLVIANYPRVTYRYNGEWVEDATLYRPLAMPTRYYVALPQKLAGRYEWFAIDRRREVVALAEEPKMRLMGRKVIKRGDPLGLDLEFRKIDGYEWRIFFYEDMIVFSNAVLSVHLDVGKAGGK